MVVTFPLQAMYPFRHPYNLEIGEVEVEVTDAEYERIRQWVYEEGFVEDYPDLEHIWEHLREQGHELMEESDDLLSPEDLAETWTADELEVGIGYPDIDVSDLDYEVE